MAKPRIIGGSAKGRSLDTPKSGTRPSPSRLREALFNILEFRPRGRFLDLYSGSGTVGLEAASRGWEAVCVDLSREASAVIRKNASALSLEVATVQGDALAYARAQPQAFEVVFAAPPYPLDLISIFQTILDAHPARAGGLYIFQHPTQLEPQLVVGGVPVTAEARVYGSNVLSFVEVS